MALGLGLAFAPGLLLVLGVMLCFTTIMSASVRLSVGVSGTKRQALPFRSCCERVCVGGLKLNEL